MMNPSLNKNSTAQDVADAIDWYKAKLIEELGQEAKSYFVFSESFRAESYAACNRLAGAIYVLDRFLVRLNGTLESEGTDGFFGDDELRRGFR